MDNLKKFRSLIQAQDLIRAVYCREGGSETEKALIKLDKTLARIINDFANQNGLISVTNQDFEE